MKSEEPDPKEPNWKDMAFKKINIIQMNVVPISSLQERGLSNFMAQRILKK